MALVLLRNKINGKLIGLERLKADDLLKQGIYQNVLVPSWEEISPKDPDYVKMCAIADGKDRSKDDSHAEHWEGETNGT